MTLSRFLRNYIYIPLGGNRRGELRRYINLLVTMLLGGLWHGAGWTFVIWGGIHGAYLVLNHAWRSFRRQLGQELDQGTIWGRGLSRVVTFGAVTVAWVFFRADSVDAAWHMLSSLAGLNGLTFPSYLANGPAGPLLQALDVSFVAGNKQEFSYGLIAAGSVTVLTLFTWYAPNTQQWMARYYPARNPFGYRKESVPRPRLMWRPLPQWAVGFALLGVLTLFGISRHSEFLYFQF